MNKEKLLEWTFGEKSLISELTTEYSATCSGSVEEKIIYGAEKVLFGGYSFLSSPPELIHP